MKWCESIDKQYYRSWFQICSTGQCKNSSHENCGFVLYNGTGNDSVVCVRMNITAEFKIGYNKTVDNTEEVSIYMYI